MQRGRTNTHYGKNHDAYGGISELPGERRDTGGSGHVFQCITESLERQKKAEELIEKIQKRNDIYNRYQSMQEKLLVAGSLQDRKESENDTFCGSRSGSRRSDQRSVDSVIWSRLMW